MRILKKYILLFFFIVPLLVFAQNEKDFKMNDIVLKDSFEIALKQRNKLEKKGINLFLNVEDPTFFLVDKNSTVRRKTSIPMVGLFQKKLSIAEIQELKEFATEVLKHPLWLIDDDGFGSSIKITQDQQSVSGKIKTTPPYDKGIAIFLEKQNTFFSTQLSNIKQYIPIKAIQVSHSVEVIQNQVVIKLFIKNIGNEKIQLINPLNLHSSATPAPHLWQAVIFQLFDKNKDLNKPDFAFTFKEGNIDSNNQKIKKNITTVEINPKEEQIFIFRLIPEEQNQIPIGQYDARVLLAFPFDAVGMQRVVVTTDQKKFTKN